MWALLGERDGSYDKGGPSAAWGPVSSSPQPARIPEIISKIVKYRTLPR